MQVSQLINSERLKNNFIDMAKIDTGSCEATKVSNAPSTEKQLEFAKYLSDILVKMGLSDISIDENGILTATLQGNIGENTPIIGFIAHIDTSEQAPTAPVNPLVHNYTSGDIDFANGVSISASDLEPYKNNTIITSDGSTLLGADDKAGIAEILEAINVFIENPALKRPTIKLAFTPDEEIGAGVENFDIKAFGADLAYTVDGSEPDMIDTETFNAYNPEVIIEGIQVHTGHAYGKMVNAIEIANEIMNRLPKDETPSKTKDKEGFFHVDSITGDVAKITMKMLVRDFDRKIEDKKVEFLENVVKDVEKEYVGSKITFHKNEKYHNMKEKLDEFKEVTEYAKEGLKRTGFNPIESSARGGTDGSSLSLRGLLTPNLGTGGVNYHSIREFVSLEVMEKCTENIIHIVSIWAENSEKIMSKILARRGL